MEGEVNPLETSVLTCSGTASTWVGKGQGLQGMRHQRGEGARSGKLLEMTVFPDARTPWRSWQLGTRTKDAEEEDLPSESKPGATQLLSLTLVPPTQSHHHEGGTWACVHRCSPSVQSVPGT